MKATVLLLAAIAVASAQSKLPADLNAESRARLPYLKKSDMDAKGQKVLETFASKDDTLRGPLAFATYNGGVGQALLDLHNAAVTGSPFFMKIDFSDTYSKTLTGDDAIVECELTQAIEYSGTRWVAQPLPRNATGKVLKHVLTDDGGLDFVEED